MGNNNSGRNYPHAPNEENRAHERESRYNTPDYYRSSRELGNSRYDQINRHPSPYDYNDLHSDYDELNTGKYERYQGDGHYGSNYGSIGSSNTGRDYEQNAGYRESYNRLTTGQWPEIEKANESRRKGEHRGKGPRSYQRSDARIREDINDRLCEDPYVDASEIEVNVENGEVTLSGAVEDKNAKRRVDDILEQVSGVKHFENRLRTRLAGNRSVNIRNSES